MSLININLPVTVKSENSKVIVVSAKIESELAELEDSDKEEMLNELGIE